MQNLKPIMQYTISVTDFVRNINKAFAGLKNGAKVIMKNNKPEAVIMSPEEYVELMSKVEDAEDLLLAQSRMKDFDKDKCVPMEDVFRQDGISEEDLEDVKVDFE